MRTFIELRESLGRNPSGKKVHSSRMGKHKVDIHKEVSGYVVYIDGDRLDSYDDEKSAKSSAASFVKQMKEEVEEIEEISKEKLGRYVKKASNDMMNKRGSASHDVSSMMTSIDNKNKKGEERYREKANRKFSQVAKRQKGIGKAVDRLTKD